MYHMSPWTSGPDPMGFNETVLAVWSYDDGKIDATDFPTTNDAPVQGVSVELNDLDLRPKIRQPAPQLTDSSFNQYFTFDFETRPGDAYQKAYVTLSSVTNASAPVSLNSTYSMPMQSPLLFDVINDNATAIASSPANVVHIKDDEIVQLIYINRDPGEHPFHYHGHFFFVLAKGTASNLSDIPTTFNNTDNPLRRDTFTVPPCDTDPKTGSCANFGYTVVRFKADNPGVWLLHCHIEWHMADGLAITIIEGAEEIRKAGLSNPSQASETCKSYNVWSSANPSLGMMMMDGRLKEDQMTRILKSSAKLTTRPAISLVMAALMVMMAIII